MNNRIAAVREQFSNFDIDALLVSAPADVRYVCGFAGSGDPREIEVLITSHTVFIIADGRNVTMAQQQCPDATVVDCTSVGRDATIGKIASEAHVYAMGIDASTCSVADGKSLSAAFPGCKPIASYIRTVLRAQKNAEEIVALRKACAIAANAAQWIGSTIRAGYTEREFAWMLEKYLREHGAERLAFETIIASGPNSANPHHHTGDRMLTVGDAVVCDYGAMVEGYHSDVSRTFFIGTPSPEQQKVYQIVYEAQQRAATLLCAGITGVAVDSCARSYIEDAGFGSFFVHGLGHGIGLEVHEYPLLSRTYVKEIPEGAVVTIEPGIYVPGQFGVRIEDDYLVDTNRSICLTVDKNL